MLDQDYLRFLAVGNAERMVDALSQEQFLRPHQPLETALGSVKEAMGVCPAATRMAMESLQLDATTLIGRLRRTELIQLARAIYRHWRQSVAQGV